MFVFVGDPAQVPPDATPFDMRGIDLGYRGGDRTFETILRGRSMICADDQVVKLTGPMFDGLYEYHRRARLQNRHPA